MSLWGRLVFILIIGNSRYLVLIGTSGYWLLLLIVLRIVVRIFVRVNLRYSTRSKVCFNNARATPINMSTQNFTRQYCSHNKV
jgi:hypothetical protein